MSLGEEEDTTRGGNSGPEEALSSQALAPASISKVILLGEKASVLQLPELSVQVRRDLASWGRGRLSRAGQRDEELHG